MLPDGVPSKYSSLRDQFNGHVDPADQIMIWLRPRTMLLPQMEDSTACFGMSCRLNSNLMGFNVPPAELVI